MLLKRYFLSVMALILLLLGIVFTFSFVIDPYGLYGNSKIIGVNNIKPVMINHARMIKAYKVNAEEPKTILLGSSTVEVGLNPDSKMLSDYPKPIYNLGLSGALEYEIYRYLQESLIKGNLKSVIFELHFTSYANKKNEVGFKEERLTANQKGNKRSQVAISYNHLQDLVEHSISSTAIIDMLKTFAYSFMNKPAVIYYANGQRNIDHWKQDLDSKSGYGGSFYLSNLEAKIKQKLAHTCSGDFDELQNVAELKGSKRQILYLSKILNLVKNNNLNMKVFISPEHVWALENLVGEGQWASYEDWKRKVVAVIDEFNIKNPETALTLWDFSGYNSITTEFVPPVGDLNRRMNNYLDFRHYAPPIGDRILNKISDKHQKNHVDDDFGMRISGDNIESHLAELRFTRQKYVSSQPQNALAAYAEGYLKRTETDCNKLTNLYNIYTKDFHGNTKKILQLTEYDE